MYVNLPRANGLTTPHGPLHSKCVSVGAQMGTYRHAAIQNPKSKHDFKSLLNLDLPSARGPIIPDTSMQRVKSFVAHLHI